VRPSPTYLSEHAPCACWSGTSTGIPSTDARPPCLQSLWKRAVRALTPCQCPFFFWPPRVFVPTFVKSRLNMAPPPEGPRVAIGAFCGLGRARQLVRIEIRRRIKHWTVFRCLKPATFDGSRLSSRSADIDVHCSSPGYLRLFKARNGHHSDRSEIIDSKRKGDDLGCTTEKIRCAPRSSSTRPVPGLEKSASL